jgi:hypothetical protein
MNTVLARVPEPANLKLKPYNVLLNVSFNKRNYPVWTSWNGVYYDNTYVFNTGSFKGIAHWVHYSPVFNQGWSTYVGNLFVRKRYDQANNNTHMMKRFYTDHGFADAAEDRIMKIYGAEDYFPNNYPTNARQLQLTRSYNLTGKYPNTYGAPRFVSNTTSVDPTVFHGGSGALYYYNNWARNEWMQIVNIPDTAVSVTFGALIKIAPDDKLKWPNWAGIYCCQDSNNASGTGNATRHVNYFGIKKSTDTYTRPTGTLTGDMAEYNWNGHAVNDVVSTSTPLNYVTPTTLYVTEHAMLDEDDYEDFRRVEYTFNLQSGTGRKLGFAIFFAESIGNMRRQAGDTTGGFQVTDPHLKINFS